MAEERVTNKSLAREMLDWLIALGIAVGLALLIRQFLFAPILVDGDSMYPTLHNGNRMINDKISYRFSEPRRFDIVVFHAPEGKDYIKRVIGMPGDTIEYKNDNLIINGKVYEEPYLEQQKKKLTDEFPLTEDFELSVLKETEGATVVPKGAYFVMGDNRRFSKDSRHIGFVKKSKIVGKTSFVFWPFSELRTVK